MRINNLVDLSSLPLLHEAAVKVEYLDEMGHMNVMWYTHLFDRATWQLFASLGMDLAYYERFNTGAFALEQHTRYLSELRQGQFVRIYSRILGRSAKRFHFMHFMIANGSGDLSATTELIGVHVDRHTRRSSALPEHIAAAFDSAISEHSQLSWKPPLCGALHP